MSFPRLDPSKFLLARRLPVFRQLATGAFAALLSMSVAVPATAAVDPALCSGPAITRLAGPHAVTHQAIVDLADLRRRLPQLEASIRAVVARDPSLGSVVADALIAAIRDSSPAVQEGTLRRDEALRWMAYQPAPGQIEAISAACLQLDRDYEAFEIAVAIAEPEAVVQAPTCAIAATRNCEAASPTIKVDLRGSSPGGRVTLTTADRPPTVVGSGDTFTVADPGPYDLDALFTVKVPAAPAALRKARVFRFLMPKICGNLAYLGEGKSQTMPAEGPAGSTPGCERSVQVAPCARPIVEPGPGPGSGSGSGSANAAVRSPVCEDGWTARVFLFGLFPTGADQQRDIPLSEGLAHERFGLSSGYGLGASVEKRFGKVLGIEAAVHFGVADSEYELEILTRSGKDNHRANFYALTAGPNFHLLGCGGPDLYVGPFLGYGGFADPNYWALDHHFRASFDGRFLWGAQLGLDLPFSPEGAWGFHVGLRYFSLAQDTDAGSFDIDPLIAEGGLAYRF